MKREISKRTFDYYTYLIRSGDKLTHEQVRALARLINSGASASQAEVLLTLVEQHSPPTEHGTLLRFDIRDDYGISKCSPVYAAKVISRQKVGAQ